MTCRSHADTGIMCLRSDVGESTALPVGFIVLQSEQQRERHLHLNPKLAFDLMRLQQKCQANKSKINEICLER